MLVYATLSQTETAWLRTTASDKWLRTCVSTRGMESRVRPSVAENKKPVQRQITAWKRPPSKYAVETPLNVPSRTRSPVCTFDEAVETIACQADGIAKTCRFSVPRAFVWCLERGASRFDGLVDVGVGSPRLQLNRNGHHASDFAATRRNCNGQSAVIE